MQTHIKWVYLTLYKMSYAFKGNVKIYVYIVKYYCEYLYDGYILLNVKWINQDSSAKLLI